MGFYYLSIPSLILIAVIYAVAIAAFRFVWIRLLHRKFTGPIVWVVVAAIVIAPWVEELWIAWNFGQACREAGTFIYKKVQVEGFYDDTTHWWRQLQESRYQFVESRDNLYGTLWRVERVGDEIRHFKIDRPTARYQYKTRYSHAPVAHKVVRHEDVVEDNLTSDLLGRELVFGRDAPWFYVGLDRPVKLCRGKRDARGSLYVNVLIPVDAEAKGNKR